MGHTSHQDLMLKLEEAGQLVTIGGTYSHYRSPDKTYTIVDIALLEATEEPAVIYKANYDEGLTWIRALSDFTATVEVDGQILPRFTKVD